MANSVHRTPRRGRQSLFYRDLASPVSASKGKFSSSGQAAAVSALRRENFGGSDLPPPPVFTLEDRLDLSPESGIADYPMSMSPEMKSDPRTPIRSSGRDFSTPSKVNLEGSSPFAVKSGQQNQQGSPGFNWWSPTKSGGESEDKGKNSPVEGVVQPGALITLPPPREVARPEIQRNSVPAGNLDEEEWVTVYGFSPADTNLVLREFEKFGVTLKHTPGPRNANWMHILYQSRSDAQKALGKDGMQINGVLIIGVKAVDPMERQALNEGLKKKGFMTLPPPSRASDLGALKASPQPFTVRNGSTQAHGPIAAPERSMVSKVMDLMFGI